MKRGGLISEQLVEDIFKGTGECHGEQLCTTLHMSKKQNKTPNTANGGHIFCCQFLFNMDMAVYSFPGRLSGV